MRTLALCLPLVLSACLAAEPIVPLLSDVDLAEDAPTPGLVAAPSEPGEGLLADLFGSGGEDAETRHTAPGFSLPYGEVRKACAMKGGDLGQEVDRAPERGRGFRLHDTNPGTVTPRVFYLTGFRDGCPRQFTGALALLGAPNLHEQVRYDPMNSDIPFSDTDTAYERIKSRVCGVGRGRPCGENRSDAIARNTTFVTVYERFGQQARWMEVLLHDGAVVATDIKAR